MKVAITDVNLIIDLIKLELVEYFFKMDFEIHTSLIVVNELNDSQYQIIKFYIDENYLKVHLLNEFELVEINNLNITKKLSYQDLSVLFLAFKIEAEVFTGDNLIKKMCIERNITVKGILWLLVEFVRIRYINTDVAKDKLSKFASIDTRMSQNEYYECLEMINGCQ